MDFLVNKHPLLVHFPIAFLMLYVLLEFLGLFIKNKIHSNIVISVLFIGVLGGVAAVLSGNLSFQNLGEFNLINQVHISLIEKHEQFATFSLWYFLLILVTRFYLSIKKKFTNNFQILFSLLALIGFYFIFKAANLGGVLVYKYGIGTDLLK